MIDAFSFAFIKGFTTTAGLIIAIGIQNAFILRQGLLRSHTFVMALLASLIDSFMIFLGVSGLGVIIASHTYWMIAAKYGGILFLFFYGCRCFYLAIFKSNTIKDEEVTGKRSLKSSVITLMAVSFLNPHMYVDTLLLIGTVGGQLPYEQRLYYIIGAIAASTIWFFLLSYGARLLIPIFHKPLAWKISDTIIGTLMWSIAISLWCS